MSEPVIRTIGLTRDYPMGGETVRALRGVDLEIPPNEFIANLQDSPDGKFIKISAEDTGAITVTNARTGESKVYKP